MNKKKIRRKIKAESADVQQYIQNIEMQMYTGNKILVRLRKEFSEQDKTIKALKEANQGLQDALQTLAQLGRSDENNK